MTSLKPEKYEWCIQQRRYIQEITFDKYYIASTPKEVEEEITKLRKLHKLEGKIYYELVRKI